MRVLEIASGDETGELKRLSEFSIWLCDVTHLDGHRLLSHYVIIKQALGRVAAIQLMRELKGECMLRLMLGDLPPCPILDWRPPINELVAPALLTFMQFQSFNVRACILVALSEQRTVKDVVNLQWSEVQAQPWSDFTRKVFNRLVPRLGCKFVFWEESSLGHPAALLFLEEEIRQTLDVTWDEFAKVASTLLRFEHFALPELDSLLDGEKFSL